MGRRIKSSGMLIRSFLADLHFRSGSQSSLAVNDHELSRFKSFINDRQPVERSAGYDRSSFDGVVGFYNVHEGAVLPVSDGLRGDDSGMKLFGKRQNDVHKHAGHECILSILE